jgi:pyruvate formate lyase activating enzyme
MTRRSFLRAVVPAVAAPIVLARRGAVLGDEKAGEPSREARLAEILKKAPRARWWIPAEGTPCGSCHAPDPEPPAKHRKGLLQCRLCAQGCALGEGERGRCRARLNVRGELRSLVYGRPLSVHIDPIEKKPFYHFLPGSSAFSLSTSGCPLRCKFCQNWQISQASPEDYEVSWTPPEDVAGAAGKRKSDVIAFTYNEPTVFAEYLIDIARAARKAGIRTAMVSCGFMTEEPLKEMCEVLSAVKVDLKGFSEGFYKDVSGAALKPVLRSIAQVRKSGVHLELVNLVVPTLNDSEEMMGKLADWIAGELGPDVPVHFTRFHPDYQLLNLPPTPVATLERAREIAMAKGIRYAFVGNVPDHPGNHTYCPSCKKAVVKRSGFFVTESSLKDGACASCGTKIAGVWR